MQVHLDFLAKNCFRRYPLKASATGVSAEGGSLPLDLLTAARFSTDHSHLELWISKVVVAGDQISVTVSDSAGIFGLFSSLVTSDFQVLKLTPVVRYAGGQLVLGPRSSLPQIQGKHTLSKLVAEFEPSLIVPRYLPSVSSLRVGDQTITGEVRLTYANVTPRLVPDTALCLQATNPNRVASRADKDAMRGTCGFNTIGSINRVLPNVNGNIDIYGIKPVDIHFTTGGIAVVGTGLALSDVCRGSRNNIPVPPGELHKYPPILGMAAEEWKSWSKNQSR